MEQAHRRLGAVLLEADGWSVPERYAGADREVVAARGAVGLADVSACGKLGVRGLDVGPLLARLTGAVPPAARTASHVALGPHPVLACRLAPDEMLVLTAPADVAGAAAVLDAAIDGEVCAHVTDLTSAYAAMDVVGPAAPALLARLIPLDLSAAVLPVPGILQGEVARVRGVVVRLDARGLPAFRLLVSRDVGEFVWTTVMDAGRDLGLSPIGRAAHATVMGGPS
jgi:heterotetrameric sarcosine oxidase gamma subunit